MKGEKKEHWNRERALIVAESKVFFFGADSVSVCDMANGTKRKTLAEWCAQWRRQLFSPFIFRIYIYTHIIYLSIGSSAVL